MEGVKVGHFSNNEGGTGVTVFLFEHDAVGGYWICGSAPATHELAALDPDNSVPECHGLVLTGGSAYGLHASLGVMRYLVEKGVGHPVPSGAVPIVPASAIYDMAYISSEFPSAGDAYQACLEASEDNQESGRIGAGTGATVGKIVPEADCMQGGIGRAVLRQANGLEVMAYAVVNCVGDVRDDGKIIAGAVVEDSKFVDSEAYLLSGRGETELFSGSNTTLVAVFTNAMLEKDEAKRIAKMASAGIGRAIAPVFTKYDGDIAFCISVGNLDVNELTLGTMAAEAVRLAILDAVTDSGIISEA